jgi:hypothetical protein
MSGIPSGALDAAKTAASGDGSGGLPWGKLLGGASGLLGSPTGRKLIGGGIIGGGILALSQLLLGTFLSYPFLITALALMMINFLKPELFANILSILFFGLALPFAFFVLSARVGLPVLLSLTVLICYAIFLAANKSTRPAGLALIWIFVIGLILIATLPAEKIAFAGPLGEAVQLQKEAIGRLGLQFREFMGGTQKYIATQTAMLSGDYYTSEVDEGATKEYGVFLEDFKQLDPVLYANELVPLTARLRVETIEKEIGVDLACTADDKKVAGEVIPARLSVAQFEQEQVECNFAPEKLPEGSHTVKLAATFDGRTLSYIRGYFVDKERLRALRAKGGDEEVQRFLGTYGITEYQPQGRQTQGPVKLGFQWPTEQPAALDAQADRTRVTLGFTIDSGWSGRVAELKGIELIIPAAFTLSRLNGQPVSPEACVGQESGEKLCTLTPKSGVIDEATTHLTFNAILEVPRSAYKDVLSIRTQAGEQREVPVGIKNFKVTANYRYTLEQSLALSIRKPKEEKAEIEFIQT